MIYKPTDLSPSAQTFDVKDTPIFFECKVDTSNVKADGFTIKVLDSENNVVFSSIPIVDEVQKPLDIKYITLIDDIRKYVGDGSTVNYTGQERTGNFASYVEGYNLVNTGLNGTYIKFPFSVAFNDKAGKEDGTVGINQIFYSETSVGGVSSQSGLYKYTEAAIEGGTYDAYEAVDIYNGQEYKWSITLYQLEDFGTPRHSSWDLPENPQYYDMPLTTGTVLGSNKIRIQGVYSDEIYGDYFVQPVKINELKYDPENPTRWTFTPAESEDETISQNDSNRVMIKSYDYTYGYIYPQTGENGFVDEIISTDENKGCNGFRIYKRGNNRDNLTAYQQVSYVFDSPLPSLDNIVASKWNKDETYIIKQCVSFNNLIYQCKATILSPSQTPPSEDTTHWERYYGESWEWKESTAAPGESYGVYTYYEGSNPNGIYIINGKKFAGNERTVLNNQVSKANYDSSGNYLGSPYNGIYYPQFSVQTANNYNTSTNYYAGDEVIYNGTIYACEGVVIGVEPGDGSTKYWQRISTPSGSVGDYSSTEKYQANDIVKNGENYYTCTGVVYGQSPLNSSNDYYWKATTGYGYKITVNWLRTPDADSWGELMNKIVLVTDPNNDNYYGKNIQIQDVNDNADAYGTINQTPFKFVLEKPIEIYKNSYPYYESKKYKNGDVVRYIKSGSYTQWSSSAASDYKAGSVVYKTTDGNIVYYICIQDVVPSVDPASDNDSWSIYKAESYYIATADQEEISRPLNDDGAIATGWLENPYLGNTGVIFYNNPLGEKDPISSTESTNGRLYIRRFDGIQPGMLLMKNSTNNEQQYVKVNSYNSTYGFITYDKLYTFDTYKPYVRSINPSISTEDIVWSPADQVGAGTKYQIKTFFRESDENAFYFYTTPVVTLHYANSNGVDFIEDRVLTPKYYVDYASNVPLYDNTVVYAKDDVCKTGSSDLYRYWKAKTDNPSAGPGSNDSTNWENVTAPWTESSSDSSHNYTTNYNQYFSYNKDDIVLYDNKRDFLLYSSSNEYSYGDKVRYKINGVDHYYMSKTDNNTNNTPPNTESISDYWEEITFNSSVDSSVEYIALVNVPVGYAPCQENIGLYWQQYVGVLFENEGYVSATPYYNNVKYDVGTNVLYNGLYYTVNQEITSFPPTKNTTLTNYSVNEHGNQVWELYKSYDSGASYEDKAKDWGAPINGAIQEGLLCEYTKSTGTWALFTGGYEEINYEGGRAKSGDNYINTFNSNEMYQKTARVFYNGGYRYEVVADTSLHLPRFNTEDSDDYFIRTDFGKPFNYPHSSIKSWEYTSSTSSSETTNNKRKYLIGDIALSKANSDNGLPDRYWVKVINTDKKDINRYIPNQDYWQSYYGPVFAGSGFDGSKVYNYNNVILDKDVSGLYFIKKNIDEAYEEMGPISLSTLSVWNAKEEYHKATQDREADKVLYNNVIYICKDDAIGQRPFANSSFWDIYPWQLYIPEITERTLKVSADYNQQQYIQWKSAQWFLFDAKGEEIIEKSDVFYDGELSYTFHGLTGRESGKEEDKFFIVRLILETYNGYRMTIDETIETMFFITQLDSEGLIDISFDCDTASVVATITKESGFIIPSDMTQATYDMTTAGNVDEGVMHLTGMMRYQKVSPSIENASAISYASPILSAAERFVHQIDTTITTDSFGGELFGLRSYAGVNEDVENESSQMIGNFRVFLEEFLKEVAGQSEYPNDSVLNERTFIRLNEKRDYLWWEANQPGSPYVGAVLITEKATPENTIAEDGNLTKFGDYKPYRTVPLYQKAGFKNELNKYPETNYLPISYEYTIESSQESLNDEYLNVDLNYSIYSNLGEFTRNSSFDGNFYPQQDFHLIQDPLVGEVQFANSSNDIYAKTSSSTEFSTAVFEENGANDGSLTEIRVRAKTSTMWSDYVYRAPNATLIGNKGAAGSHNNTEYFTRKNVWDTVGWKWEDSNDNGDAFWADADFITEYKGYQSYLGGVSLNGVPVDSYEVWFNDDSVDIQDRRSNTVFKPQIKLEQSFTERKFLQGKEFLFDVDLTMDADGYIVPTSIEDLVPSREGFLKVVAYSTNSESEPENTNN